MVSPSVDVVTNGRNVEGLVEEQLNSALATYVSGREMKVIISIPGSLRSDGRLKTVHVEYDSTIYSAIAECKACNLLTRAHNILLFAF